MDLHLGFFIARLAAAAFAQFDASKPRPDSRVV
jgi:hypothetical protein